MKSPVLFLAALVLGFLGGWFAKPSPQTGPPPPPLPRRDANTAPSSPRTAETAVPKETPQSTAPQPATGPPATDGIPAAETLPSAALGADAAKMARLGEILQLDEDGIAALEGVLRESRAAWSVPAGDGDVALDPARMLEHVTKVGADLEKAVEALLATPEQKSAFADLRQRTRDNRIEAKLQREVAAWASVTDLLPEQRGTILAHLREVAQAEANALPAGQAFLLDAAALPLGPMALSEEALSAMTLAAAGPHADPFQRSAIRTEELLIFFESILTPAQCAQAEQAAEAQRAIHNRIRQVPPPR